MNALLCDLNGARIKLVGSFTVEVEPAKPPFEIEPGYAEQWKKAVYPGMPRKKRRRCRR